MSEVSHVGVVRTSQDSDTHSGTIMANRKTMESVLALRCVLQFSSYIIIRKRLSFRYILNLSRWKCEQRMRVLVPRVHYRTVAETEIHTSQYIS
jgi:hypothetical protein